ncbi:MAG TPA: MFS transporter [Gaiellales bacterium]
MATEAPGAEGTAGVRSAPLTLALAIAVATVLADSSVVVLALPDLLSALHVSIERVAWVITAFNLALALAALPAAQLAARAGAARVTCAGLAGFALASAVCTVAGSIDVLLAARVVQAVFGAAVVCGALALLPKLAGTQARGLAVWAAAAAAGAAAGPAAGGALTQAFTWRGVFAAQVPLALVPLALLVHGRVRDPERTAGGRVWPRPWPNLALALVSAALTAALFLLVLMLVRGWGLDPLAAAAVLSVIPVAAIATSAFLKPAATAPAPVAAGVILIAGGLAALALVPSAAVVWTLVPQALIGAGLALTLPGLTHTALAGAGPAAIHGGWTIAARHAGVVIGLVILTPIFTTDLVTQQAAAERSGTSLVLNSKLSLDAKLRLGDAIDRSLHQTQNRLPDLRPAFRAQHPSAADRPTYEQLRAALTGQVRRAATHAFSRAFLVAAGIALLALAALAPGWREAAT